MIFQWVMVLGHRRAAAALEPVPAPLRGDDHPDRPRRLLDLHPDQVAARARELMAEIGLSDVEKYFGANYVIRQARTSRSPTASSWCCSGRRAAARPRRCAPSPGSRRSTRGDILIDGRPVQDAAARRARHRLRVPALRALPAPDRLREHRLPAARHRREPGRDRPQGARRGGVAADRAAARQAARRRSPAATCSGWRSAGRWCGGRRRC